MKIIKKIAIAILIIAMLLIMTCEPKDPYYEQENTPYMSDVVVLPNKVYAKGTHSKTKSGTLLNNFEYVGSFTLTAYCNCAKCCGRSGQKTASGTTPKEGRTIAVDPKVIPLGTKVKIDGETYIAEDTGGAIKHNKIDIFFNSHQEALDFGVKKNVEVYKKKPPKIVSLLKTIKGSVKFGNIVKS